MSDQKIGNSDTIKENLSEERFKELESKLEGASGEELEKLGQTRVKRLFITTVLSAVLGLFGAGSFYLGRIRAGILKIVFNVVVPLTLAVVFLGWLAPECKLYSAQSYNLATGLYLRVNDLSETDKKQMTVIDIENTDWLESAMHIFGLKNNFQTAISKSGIKYSLIETAYEQISKADKIEFSEIENAEELKGVLDLLNLHTVSVGEDGTSVSLIMGFAELMSEPSELTVENLPALYDEYTKVMQKANTLIAKIETINYEDEIGDALSAVSQTALNIKKQIVNDNDSLLKQLTDFQWFADLKTTITNLRTKLEIDEKLDKNQGYSKKLDDITDSIELLQTCKLSENKTAVSNIVSALNGLYLQALDSSYNYISNNAMATWLTATFLIIDGITILCWWIGEVFHDRKKCLEQNYQRLLKAIEN